MQFLQVFVNHIMSPKWKVAYDEGSRSDNDTDDHSVDGNPNLKCLRAEVKASLSKILFLSSPTPWLFAHYQSLFKMFRSWGLVIFM